jgi:hypothetical protein
MTKNQPIASRSTVATALEIPTGLFHLNTPPPHNEGMNEPTFPTLNEGYINPNATGQPPISPGGPPQYVQAVLKACPIEKVAEPSIFDGIPSKFTTWLHQIQIYLAVNTANYTTGWMKTFFLLLYMKEGAANVWAKEYQVSRDYSTTDYTTANFNEHCNDIGFRARFLQLLCKLWDILALRFFTTLLNLHSLQTFWIAVMDANPHFLFS